MSIGFWAGVLIAEAAIIVWLLLDDWLTVRCCAKINAARAQIALIYFDRVYRAAAAESFWKALP